MAEELKIDKRSLRGVHRTIQKVIERMNKLLVVNETKYGYSMECEDDELYEAYSSLRYVDVIIGDFLERRKEQGHD